MGLSFMLPPAMPLEAPQAAHVQKIDVDLTVYWHRQTITASPRALIFEDRVEADYAGTKLYCDKLTLYLEEGHKHGLAEGNVRLVDPDGTLDASRIFFDWVGRTGSGEDVAVHSHGVMMRAQHVIIQQKIWTAENIYATPCDGEGTPLFEIHAPRAVISPGGDATLFRPRIYVLGHHVFNMKQYQVSQTRRGAGQSLPSVSYSKSGGFSAGIQPNYQIDDQTLVASGFHVGQHQKPSRDILLSRSLLPVSTAPGGFIPRSDLDERFSFSYFENVYVKTPQQETAYLSGRRLSLSLGTTFNEGAAARRNSTALTKPLEAVLEGAGAAHGLAIFGQVRAQRIQEVDGPAQNRTVGYVSIAAPPLTLVPGLYTDIRADAADFLNRGGSYGWAHFQAGLVARPSRALRIGAAWMNAAEWGEPAFESDRLFSMHSVHVRGDLLLGPTKLSVLSKYDLRGRRWFDNEFEISQAIRCVEPYFVYRQFPRGFSFGLRVRLDNLYEALRRRQRKGPERFNSDLQ
jgi:hypothetical protein